MPFSFMQVLFDSIFGIEMCAGNSSYTVEQLWTTVHQVLYIKPLARSGNGLRLHQLPVGAEVLKGHVQEHSIGTLNDSIYTGLVV